jgi:hypothetical protein
LNARALIAKAATIQVLGVHLRRSPKPGACQQDEAENKVAGGDLNGFGHKVNGAAPWNPADGTLTLYELVIPGPYSVDARAPPLTVYEDRLASFPPGNCEAA